MVGFAAFSATPLESTQTADGVALTPTASGRVAATALGARLSKPSAATSPITDDAVASDEAPDLQALTLATLDELPEDPTTTTTAAPTTTTSAPAADTATAAAEAPPATSAPTTTTVAPTTTTAAPTTTTVAPTTTTAAPTTTTRPPPAKPPSGVEHWRPLVTKWFPAEWVDDALRVMACESGGDPNAYNPSSSASGLFQFIPSTWSTARASAGWYDADVFDPEANIAVAAWLTSVSSPTWRHWSCKP